MALHAVRMHHHVETYDALSASITELTKRGPDPSSYWIQNEFNSLLVAVRALTLVANTVDSIFRVAYDAEFRRG